ncbi:hypothetical protein PFISCL1PPCAC_9707, partial [Pristionchus fissidentatus]
SDIIEVECTQGWKSYNFLHSQIWTDKIRFDNCRNNETRKSDKERPPSVYIMVMDSFSASHARRVFPKTLHYLKEQFGSIEMLHMNKIGDNSRPPNYLIS